MSVREIHTARCGICERDVVVCGRERRLLRERRRARLNGLVHSTLEKREIAKVVQRISSIRVEPAGQLVRRPCVRVAPERLHDGAERVLRGCGMRSVERRPMRVSEPELREAPVPPYAREAFVCGRIARIQRDGAVEVPIGRVEHAAPAIKFCQFPMPFGSWRNLDQRGRRRQLRVAGLKGRDLRPRRVGLGIGAEIPNLPYELRQRAGAGVGRTRHLGVRWR